MVEELQIEEARDRRFDGVRRLYGDALFAKIQNSRVLIVGLGGVGSWTVEAIARSGVGHIVLVDMDEVCISNINRQIHALPETVGKSKAAVLQERISSINPLCTVTVKNTFFTEKTVEDIFSSEPSVIVDAIDRVTNKTLLIATAVSRGVPIVTTGSAGNRVDPSMIKVEDLAHTIHDPLLAFVRKKLRAEYGFPRTAGKKFKVPCVYAPLQKNRGITRYDESVICDTSDGIRTCNDGMGTVAYMTGAVGLLAASEAMKLLAVRAS
jgi:tRNA A37 threonylcarbamoyladenosine dehydratase